MGFRGSEWLILILLLVVLFGAKRLPDAARGLGRSLRIFKAETKGLVEDTKSGYQAGAASAESPETAPASLPAAPIAPAAAPLNTAEASAATAEAPAAEQQR